MTNENTVFISYSSKDLEYVNNIIKELDAMGVSYWKAPERIPAGSSYAREIPKAIQNCAVFLLVLSPHSQDSIWVEKEIDSAICNRKIIIPFQIRAVELNDTFRFYLNNVQMISYLQDSKNAFVQLKKQLEQLIPGMKKEGNIESQTDTKKDALAVVSGKSISVEQRDESQPGDPRNRILSSVSVTNRTGAKDKNTNALRMNRIPLACQYCGCKQLENVTMGIYRCIRCNRDNYDDFQTIRNFLEKTGATSALVIERETGVPRRIIEHFFRNEYLEIPKNSTVRVPCECCGAPIRTGTRCEECKTNPNKTVRAEFKGAWHSLW